MNTTAKVIPFNKGFAGKAANDAAPGKNVKKAPRTNSYSKPAKNAGLMMLRGFGYAAFLIMSWLRPVLRLPLMVLSGLTMFSALVMYAIVPEGQPNKWFILGSVAAVSFVCFLLAYVYDRILLSLDPAGHEE